MEGNNYKAGDWVLVYRAEGSFELRQIHKVGNSESVLLSHGHYTTSYGLKDIYKAPKQLIKDYVK